MGCILLLSALWSSVSNTVCIQYVVRCRCFGLLLSHGRNVKHSDMNLVEMVRSFLDHITDACMYTKPFIRQSFDSKGHLPFWECACFWYMRLFERVFTTL